MAISLDGVTSLNTAMQSLDMSSLNGEYQTTRTEGGGPFGWGSTTVAGASLVGITPELVTNFGSALDSYKSEIGAYLDSMSAQEATVGFKGEAVNGAIQAFVARVIEVSKEYLDALDEVHRDMINQVAANYTAQDSGISSSMTSDGSAIYSDQRYAESGGGN